MSLRSRIFLFLFVFALLPLLVAVVINLPLVLDRVELFYRQAFLQNLRADFSDLDTHLASRDEMIRLLAKLPEPGLVLGQKQQASPQQIDLARLKYTEWINRILRDQLDILDVVFIDSKGVPQFWLSRDSNTHVWMPVTEPPHLPSKKYLDAVLHATTPAVFLTPVAVDEKATDLRHSITLQLLSPLGPYEGEDTYGAVVITVDIGGLVRRDNRTLWVHDNGHYLSAPGIPKHEQTAFDEFPGLEQHFAAKKVFMWEGDNAQTIIWVPLLRTSEKGFLWVGRPVRNQPMLALRDALIVRVLAIIFALVVLIALIARWVASRLECYGSELFHGIQRILTRAQAVEFRWRGSPELRELGKNLSQLSRTHERNLKELQDHARALEESNRYKSEFLANVSHELRTPLNSILLLSKLLFKEGQCINAEQKQQLQVIHEASEDLRKLIDNILDLSRVEAGRLAPVMERVDLHLLLKELQHLMQPQFEQKGLDLLLDVASDAPQQIETDADKLKQILKNFLSNALKFTAHGGVTLGLSAAPEPHAVRLWVRDTGIGIARDKHELVFEAFRQADGSTRRRFGGTGLGLSISRELAVILCGEISVDSEQGKGAEFSLLLPQTCGDSPQPRPLKVAARQPANTMAKGRQRIPKARFQGHSALLVENDIESLLRWSHILEQWEMQVSAAADEEEVRETLEEEPDIDLVFVREGVVEWKRISDIVNELLGGSVLLIGLSDDPQANGLKLAVSPGIDAHALKLVLEQQLLGRRDDD